MKIQDTSIIITGGGSGLGAATARRLSGAGAKIGILDFDAQKGEAVAHEIGGNFVQADITDEQAVESAVKHLNHENGIARGLVNCAGIGVSSRIVGREGKLSIDLFEKVLKVNLFGSYCVMSHVLRDMTQLDPLEDGARGVVINTASAAYQDGQLGQAAYAASKGGIASMVLPAAREMAQHGIRICAIAPGLFHTPMMETLSDEVREGIIANIPFPKRLGHGEEFAALAQHIIENSYINGEVIRLDGATRLPPR